MKDSTQAAPIYRNPRKFDSEVKESGGEAPDGEDGAGGEEMGDIMAQAKEVQRYVEKVYFLSVLKRFGLAFGGILLFLGAMSATAFFLLFFGVFSLGLPPNLELLLEIGLGGLALVHILSGLALLAG